MGTSLQPRCLLKFSNNCCSDRHIKSPVCAASGSQRVMFIVIAIRGTWGRRQEAFLYSEMVEPNNSQYHQEPVGVSVEVTGMEHEAAHPADLFPAFLLLYSTM